MMIKDQAIEVGLSTLVFKSGLSGKYNVRGNRPSPKGEACHWCIYQWCRFSIDKNKKLVLTVQLILSRLLEVNLCDLEQDL